MLEAIGFNAALIGVIMLALWLVAAETWMHMDAPDQRLRSVVSQEATFKA